MFLYSISPGLVVSHCSQEHVRNDDPMVWWHASCNLNASTIRKAGSTTMFSGASLKRKESKGSTSRMQMALTVFFLREHAVILKLSPHRLGDSLETALVSVSNSSPTFFKSKKEWRIKALPSNFTGSLRCSFFSINLRCQTSIFHNMTNLITQCEPLELTGI